MNDYFPNDRIRQFLITVFIVLAAIEFSRASYIWGVIDVIFAISFSPKVRIWALHQWRRIFTR